MLGFVPKVPRRYVFIALIFVASLYPLLKISGYDPKSSQYPAQYSILGTPNSPTGTNYQLLCDSSCNSSNTNEPIRRANATFVILCRNDDLNAVAASIQSMEDRFNKKYNYPWVLLNEEPFTPIFKERIQILTRAPISFGLIPNEDWFQPDWINETKAAAGRMHLQMLRIVYANSIPYRNMCRFNSGFFYKHELLKQYKFYWRVEPGVKYFCDLRYDPFLYMQDNNKVYGFTVSLLEWGATISTLWDAVKEFIAANPQYIPANNSIDFISEDNGESYNLCHYWSNFEIADLDFWRSTVYNKFFEHLDSKGGFYYERWGDAPIHSIAVSLFTPREKLHFFSDIGYRHEPFQHCPWGDEWLKGRCSCDPLDTFDHRADSCLRKYKKLIN